MEKYLVYVDGRRPPNPLEFSTEIQARAYCYVVIDQNTFDGYILIKVVDGDWTILETYGSLDNSILSKNEPKNAIEVKTKT